MISAIIPTLNDAARLPRTLKSLYPAAWEDLVSQVIFADGGSEDPTRTIAEEAGCDMIAGDVRRAASIARGRWLLILKPGTSLQDGWSKEALRFIEEGDDTRAAIFRSGFWNALLKPGDQALLISRKLYEARNGAAPRNLTAFKSKLIA